MLPSDTAGDAVPYERRRCRVRKLTDDSSYDFSRNIRQSEITSVEQVRKLGVIHTQQCQYRGMQIVDADSIYNIDAI